MDNERLPKIAGVRLCLQAIAAHALELYSGAEFVGVPRSCPMVRSAVRTFKYVGEVFVFLEAEASMNGPDRPEGPSRDIVHRVWREVTTDQYERIPEDVWRALGPLRGLIRSSGDKIWVSCREETRRAVGGCTVHDCQMRPPRDGNGSGAWQYQSSGPFYPRKWVDDLPFALVN